MRRIIRGCSALGLTVLLTAGRPAAGAGIEVVDDSGVRLELPHPVARIISLAPGATEMLFAAGAGAKVVATVAYSDVPAAARAIARIGDANAIDMERVLALKPDVVVFWPGGNNAAQIAQLRRLHLTLYGQQVDRLADLPASLRRLAVLAGTTGVAGQRAAQIERQLIQLRDRYSHRPPVTAMLETWNQPLYTVGGRQIMSDALSVCGAVNVFGDLTQLSPAVQVEAVLSRDPDLIIVAPPPGGGAQWLAQWRRFPQLKAVRSGNLIDFEDQALGRLGPSVLDATARLCAQIDAARARMVNRGNY